MGSCYLVNLTVKNLLERFPKRNCRKQNQKELRIENLIKRKDDKQHVKWKGYNNLFNSWNNKNRRSINE